jgi:SAM-dependent methyltransferase
VASAADVERTGGPFVPTPQTVVDAMLDLAKVRADDFVVDLGSGDGRIVLTAAQRFSARGVGVEIDPELVEKSNAEAKKRGMSQRIKFIQKDVLQADVREATVLTLYLLPGMMQSLQSKLVRELRPGTRIVSHDFAFGDWKADRELSVDVPEKFGQPGQWKSTLYYWVVPARIAGAWKVSLNGDASEDLLLSLDQRYQNLNGAANVGGKRVPFSNARVEADRIEFKLELADGAYEFRGLVDGDTMHGEAVHAGRTTPWRASKAGSPAAR